MGKKENFGRAMYDMFGVGKEGGGEPKDQPQDQHYPSGEGEGGELFPAYVDAAKQGAVEEFRVEQQAVAVHTFQGTYLAAGTVMSGTLSAKGDVEVAGDFQGEIIAKGKVTLHSDITSKITASGLVLVGCHLTGDVDIAGDVSLDGQSTVVGDIKAENVICSGRVKGDLVVQENLVLEPEAEIDGNIKVDTMTMAKGARIMGNIEMGGVGR